jgi:hypothetical protein
MVLLVGSEVKSLRDGKVSTGRLRTHRRRSGSTVCTWRRTSIVGFGTVDPDRPRKLLHHHARSPSWPGGPSRLGDPRPLAIYFKEGGPSWSWPGAAANTTSGPPSPSGMPTVRRPGATADRDGDRYRPRRRTLGQPGSIPGKGAHEESLRLGPDSRVAVGCNWSLLVVAVLLALGLADGRLPLEAPGYPREAYCWPGRSRRSRSSPRPGPSSTTPSSPAGDTRGGRHRAYGAGVHQDQGGSPTRRRAADLGAGPSSACSSVWPSASRRWPAMARGRAAVGYHHRMAGGHQRGAGRVGLLPGAAGGAGSSRRPVAVVGTGCGPPVS